MVKLLQRILITALAFVVGIALAPLAPFAMAFSRAYVRASERTAK